MSTSRAPIADPRLPPEPMAESHKGLPDAPLRNWVVVLAVAGLAVLVPFLLILDIISVLPTGLLLLLLCKDDYHRGLGRSLLLGTVVGFVLTLLQMFF